MGGGNWPSDNVAPRKKTFSPSSLTGLTLESGRRVFFTHLGKRTKSNPRQGPNELRPSTPLSRRCRCLAHLFIIAGFAYQIDCFVSLLFSFFAALPVSHNREKVTPPSSNTQVCNRVLEKDGSCLFVGRRELERECEHFPCPPDLMFSTCRPFFWHERRIIPRRQKRKSPIFGSSTIASCSRRRRLFATPTASYIGRRRRRGLTSDPSLPPPLKLDPLLFEKKKKKTQMCN